MTKLCWDYDYIKYTIGSACEVRSIIVTHTQSGNQKEFKTRTEFWGHYLKKEGGWLGEINKGRDSPYLAEEFTVEDVQKAEPVEFALQTVKNHISGIKEKLGISRYYGYIGHGESWRVEKSTIMEYKGSRKANLKPLLMPQIEEYLFTKHGAVEIEGLEADDQCVIDAYADDDTVVVGVDKDYMGCEISFFNIDKMETPLVIRGLGELYLDAKEEVRGYGRKWFYFQVMSGDASDCYKANSATSKKWGDKSAYKLLAPCTTDAECWQAMVDGYKKLYPEPSKFIGWRGNELDITWDYVLNENCIMAHMLRHKDDEFKLMPLLDKLKIKY